MTEYRSNQSSDDEKPKYIEVVEWVKEEIASGRLKVGDKMPTERQLAEQFHLSRMTVRHATGILEKERLITRVRGSGTFIGNFHTSRRQERYGTVAVISTYIDSYIFPKTLRGMQETLQKNGYAMQLSFTDNQIEMEAAILSNILKKDNIDGLIVEPSVSALPNPNIPMYEELRSRGIPILFFNAKYPDFEAPCVRIDDREVGRSATKILVDKELANIGFLGKCDDVQGPLRYAGYLEEMMAAGKPRSTECCLWLDTWSLNHMNEMESFLWKRLMQCNGIVCYNDRVAFSLSQILERHGMHCPQQIELTGCDEADIATAIPGPFHTFTHPKDKLGNQAAENIVRMIDDPVFDGNTIFPARHVIVGGT